MVITYYSKGMDQPGKVANPLLRGQLNVHRACILFLCPRCSRLRIWSRETGSAVPSRVSFLVLHTQAESGAYLLGSSRINLYKAAIHTLSGQSRVYRVAQLRIPTAFTAESLPAQGQ